MSSDDGVSLALAGFRACYDDAVFYLTEVEGLQESDPAVVGLKQHLDEQWRQMYVELLLSELRGGEVKDDARNGRAPCYHPSQRASVQRDSSLFGHPLSTCDNAAAAVDSLPTLPILLNNPDLFAIASELLCAIEDEQQDDTCDWDDDDDDDDFTTAE